MPVLTLTGAHATARFRQSCCWLRSGEARLAVWAQQPDRVRRIESVDAALESDSEYHVYVSDFREELQKLGWAEGRNLRIDYRSGTLNAESGQRIRDQLVAVRPHLIPQNTPTTASLRQQTRTIPIVLLGSPIRSAAALSRTSRTRAVTSLVSSRWRRRWPQVMGLLKEIARASTG